MLTFERCFDRLLGHEGGYSHDPLDPGGETNWGISKRSYPHLDIKTLTRDQAKHVYEKDFWMKLNCDRLIRRGFDGVAFQLFDFAVNSGIPKATKYFQRTVRVVDDGNWGPKSQAAAEVMSETDMIMRLLGFRLKYMVTLKNWKHAGGGWANRIGDNLLYGAEDS